MINVALLHSLYKDISAYPTYQIKTSSSTYKTISSSPDHPLSVSSYFRCHPYLKITLCIDLTRYHCFMITAHCCISTRQSEMADLARRATRWVGTFPYILTPIPNLYDHSFPRYGQITFLTFRRPTTLTFDLKF